MESSANGKCLKRFTFLGEKVQDIPDWTNKRAFLHFLSSMVALPIKDGF